MVSSFEEKEAHRRRMKNKQKDAKKRKYKVRSPAAEVLADPLFHQRIVKDKRGKEHNLETLTHRQLIEAINEDEDE